MVNTGDSVIIASPDAVPVAYRRDRNHVREVPLLWTRERMVQQCMHAGNKIFGSG
jgi:hypothetical protein